MQFGADCRHQRGNTEPTEEAQKKREPRHVESTDGGGMKVIETDLSGFVANNHEEHSPLEETVALLQATCTTSTTESRPSITMPSFTSTGKVRTCGKPSTHGLVTSPVSRQIRQLCSGHGTVVPPTMPSASGPPWCGQRFTTARKRPPVLQNARESQPTDRPRHSPCAILSA